MKNFFIIVLLILTCMHSVFADNVSGTIVFEKKPPLSGIVYSKVDSPKSQSASIDQKNKMFTSTIIAGTPGSKVIFNNGDTHDHNIFVNDIDYGVNFDVGLVPSGGRSEIEMDWKEDSLVRIGCKIHPKMKAYLANINSENYQLIEFEKGVLEYSFTLADVTSDNVVLKLPKYDTIDISLKSGESQTIELMRKGKKRGVVTLKR